LNALVTNSKTRIESDRFGECEIPEDALWGVQTQRSVDNLSFSSKQLSEYNELVFSFMLVKKAAAEANQKAGILSEEISSQICSACDEILNGQHLDQFPVDMLHGGGGIAFNMNVNEVISNLANRRSSSNLVQAKEHVNASQSTADVCHTAFRLSVLDLHERLDAGLNSMISVLTDKGEKLLPIKTIARTCLQDAMPVSLGELFRAYAAMISRRRRELQRAIEELKAINLGGTVIGSSDSAPVDYRKAVVPILSSLAGRELNLRENLFDAAENVDDLAVVSSQLEHLAQSLLKIASDLRLLSSGPEAGFAELVLPRVQEGSSFFTAKNNPVIPETVINCCFQIFGMNRTVQAAIEHAELYLNVFESVAATNTLDAQRLLTEAIGLFTERCLSGIEANKERCAEYAGIASLEAARTKEKKCKA